MQQYIQSRCDEINRKYYQRECTLQKEKEDDCYRITSDYVKNKNSYATKKKVSIWVAEVAVLLIGIIGLGLLKSGTGFIFQIALCIGVYYLIKYVFKETERRIESDYTAQLDIREKRLQNDIQQINVYKGQEKKRVETEINQKMNQYRRTFEQSKTCIYLVEWIVNVLSIEITKADRSRWLPQVKASMRFRVSYGNIEVVGFGKYDMINQGIHVDNNPMAIGALAYVLENKTLAEARKRFQIDSNGGRAVFTSRRDDSLVEIMYSAPNGGAQTTR